MRSLDGCYPWQPGGCEWTLGFFWHWMSRFGHLDVVVLALMLIYLLRVFIRVCWRYYVARRAQGIDIAGRRTIVATLAIEVGNLWSIAVTAPYLGLAGTCIGILDALGGGAMQRDAFRSIIATKIAVALIPTAIATPVAVLATYSHKYLRALVDLLENEASDDALQRGRRFRGARRFPPTKRFSELPAFALIAAPGLAIATMGFITFASLHPRTGFYVDLASARCDGDDRLIVLHITDAGKLFLNLEQEKDWNTLANRLSQIYSMREHRMLYLLADSDVPFQTVADALDTADKLDIQVQLATPKVFNTHCLPKPVVTGSGH